MPPINRRKFLSVSWAALTTATAMLLGGIGLWHVYPRSEKNTFGGIFVLDSAPQAQDPPQIIPQGKFAWLNTGEGVAALSISCPHMGCILTWHEASGRFECPCHGSKFEKTGDIVHGPADHEMDRFVVTAVDASGQVVDQTSASRLAVIAGREHRYQVDTGNKLAGAAAGRTDE